MIYFAHEKNPKNPGDASCSPAYFFDFGKSHEVINMSELSNLRLSVNDSVILGGGGMLNDMYLPILEDISHKAKNLVFWSIGTNRHFWPGRIDSPLQEKLFRFLACTKENFLRSFCKSIYTKQEKKLLKNASLVGLRDMQSEFPCLPCPTCLHPIFDQVKDKSVIYNKSCWIGHQDFLTLPTNQKLTKIPYIGSELSTVVREMANYSKIFTSSYHCAYWGMLLVNEVKISSFSTKHLYLSQLAEKAKESELSFLDWCRSLNHKFKEKVEPTL